MCFCCIENKVLSMSKKTLLNAIINTYIIKRWWIHSSHMNFFKMSSFFCFVVAKCSRSVNLYIAFGVPVVYIVLQKVQLQIFMTPFWKQQVTISPWWRQSLQHLRHRLYPCDPKFCFSSCIHTHHHIFLNSRFLSYFLHKKNQVSWNK